jgi:hypothetical protein
MIDNWTVLDRIEIAGREMPSCACGRETVTVAHTDGFWLECASLGEPGGSRLERLLSVLTGPGHARRMIVEMVEDAA